MSKGGRFSLGRMLRLSGQLQFRAVFDAKVRKSVGPLLVYGRANGLADSRLGLSVSRRVGNAVVRNRAKRMLREAFRLSRHDWPAGYDLVVVVRAHEPLTLADYQRMLGAAAVALDQQWRRKNG